LIFDTDILIWFLRKDAAAAEFIAQVPLAERNISSLTYLELLYGCKSRKDLIHVRQLVADAFAEVVPLTETITLSAQQLMERFVLWRRPDAADVLIAATALNRREALATANRKHFDFVPGLDVSIFKPSQRRGS
jgi:predicted nucleic acid-binding protein